MSFSAEIGWAVMDELSKFRDCSIKDIVGDGDIYGEIVDCIIDVIEYKLENKAFKIEQLLLDMD